MRKLNILFLTPRFPFPLIGGDRVKPYFLLKHLAKNHNVTLITFFQGKKLKDEYKSTLLDLGLDLKVIHLNPIKAGLNCLINILKYQPLEIDYYYNSEYQKTVDLELNKNKYDIAFSFFMRTAEYLKNKKIKKVLIAEDCRTLYQKRSYEETTNIKQKFIRKWEYDRLKKYEPNIMNYFDLTSLVTKDDAFEMQKLNPNAKIDIITNGTKTDYFTNGEFAKRKDILITGKLNIWSNVIMCQRIVNDILPLILNKIPNAKLNIVGAEPTKEVLALKSENVNIIENVPEILPYLQQTRLFLHPHLGGSGIQNKLIEALSAGCPVITTNTGNQGINANHLEHAVIANGNEEIAKYAIQILENDDLAYKLSINARQLVLDNLSWDVVFKQIDSVTEKVVNYE